MSPEERLDALADVLAEGFLYIDENGGLDALSAASETIPPSEPGKKEAV